MKSHKAVQKRLKDFRSEFVLWLFWIKEYLRYVALRQNLNTFGGKYFQQMIKPNYKYLAFDDRLLMLFGIPFITILLPLLFFGMTIEELWQQGFSKLSVTGLFSTIFWFFGRTVIIEFRKRFPTLDQFRKRIIYQAIIFIIGVPVINVVISFLLAQIVGLFGYEITNQPGFVISTFATYFLIFACVLLYETIYFIHKYRETLMEKNQLQLAHVQGQLENLRNQINPHFLFNSLNTLMSLIPVDSDRAMDYLSKLSKFYRFAVSSQKEPLVDLQTELDNAELYADLLKERFYYAIEIHFHYEQIPNKYIVPLCLQLLIENSIKHNIVSQAKPLTIDVQINPERDYIYVKNNLQRKIEEVGSTGMGLKNIKSRIAFFSKKTIEVEETATSFSVGIPLIEKS